MIINGPAFKKARESRLLSITELGKKAEVSATVIKNLELGKARRLESIRKVIAAFELTIDEARAQRLIAD
ncbi:MAG: helix-turn-helix transcriptional regulator [Deltaproteobacteria bacterium]|jgi:predicted transcriptional regulator|nr:helix-turn-helix transcriptional regulator [Deltaproteobacteria bacterium]